MSAPAGVWRLDSLLDRSTAALTDLPVSRVAGLAMHAGSPEPDGSVCAFDGRLDDPAPPVDPSAAALGAWRRRGAAGFRDLIGDWSLALWDAGRRAVVLASDYAGVRPLYYSFDGRRLLWSTSLARLASVTGGSLEPRYIAGFLAQQSAAGLTPYRGIRSVPAGHAVVVRDGRERTERSWDLPVDQNLRLSGAHAYKERLIELFRDAVESRVRGQDRVCAELSGGLDSSSVVSMAARVHPRVTTFSYTHGDAADEPFVAAMESQLHLEAVHLDVAETPFALPGETGGAAPAWWAPRHRVVAGRLSALGSTVLLTGQLGDLVMGNAFDDSDQVSGHLRRFQLRAAAREAYEWSRCLRVPIYPILWRALKMTLSSWTPEPAADLTPTSWQRRVEANSLTPYYARIAAEAEPDPCEYEWRSAPPERRRRFRAMARMLSSRRLQAPEPLQHISFTHPYAHRPLVEFMLTIPPELVCGPHEPRRLMRFAFATLLPEAVLYRRSKASFGQVFDAALRPMAAALLARPEQLRTVEMGFLDRASLLQRLERFGKGLDCNAPQLRSILLLEYWLRGRI